MTLLGHQFEMPTILVVGPPPTMVGGIASVVEQMLSLDFEGRFRLAAFANTFSTDNAEPFVNRLSRHIQHAHALSEASRLAAPGIVHIHTCSGPSLYRSAVDMFLARRTGCRTVLHMHGAAFDEFYAESGAFQRKIIAWTLETADRVLALSEGWRKKLALMAPRARIAVVENAVPQPDAEPDRGHDGPCRALLLSRMDEWKGIDDLLEAAGRLRDECCALEITLAGPPGTAGDGDTLGDKIQTRRLGGRVRYVGTVRGDEKERLLRWADVYVQPSHHEGLPISMLEALSFGLPVVATRVGAVPEVLTDRREGLLVEPRRPDCLARALSELAEDVAMRRRMGLSARRSARARFSLRRLRDDLALIYEQVLAGQAACNHAAKSVHSALTRNVAALDGRMS